MNPLFNLTNIIFSLFIIWSIQKRRKNNPLRRFLGRIYQSHVSVFPCLACHLYLISTPRALSLGMCVLVGFCQEWVCKKAWGLNFYLLLTVTLQGLQHLWFTLETHSNRSAPFCEINNLQHIYTINLLERGAQIHFK